MIQSIFFTHTVKAVIPGASDQTDAMGVPIPVPPVKMDIPANYTPAMNADVDQAASDQTIVGYVVQTPNTYYRDLSEAEWLELPLPGEEDVQYRVVGRIGYIPDGFELMGYCQMTVERVKG